MNRKVRLDGKEITAEVKGDLLILDGKEHRVRSADLERKRKENTFKIIVTIVVILLLGSIVFLFLQHVLGGEEQGDPYLELDGTNEMDLKIDPSFPASSLFVEGGDPVFVDLQDHVEYDAHDGLDIFQVTDNITGSTSLNIVWTGDAVDLRLKGISVMEVRVDSSARYRLDQISFLVVDQDHMIKEQRDMTLSTSLVSTTRTDMSTYEVRFDRVELGAVRSMQLEESSRNRLCWISLVFPDGIPEGEHAVSVSYGPEYYHESTNMDILIGGVVGFLTIVVAGLALMDMMREFPVLVVVTEDDELVLYGDEKELARLNYDLSKVMISRMREEEAGSRKEESPERFRVGKEEKKKMKEEMEELPGKPGKIMIQQCPECGSSELYYESGFITGYVYHCKRCDYIGSFIIENELDLEE